MTLCFKVPNVWCDATDPAGRPRLQWVAWASSTEDMQARLEERDWTVHTVRDYDFAADWQQDVAALTQVLLKHAPGSPLPEFDSEKWRDLKRHLFELFDGKCAYCEQRVTTVDYGDVEHYRPKRRVEEEPTHPGYYWLAYDAHNFLPACVLCNRGRGKANHFPVRDGTRATTPAGLAGEEPLLYHPYEHDATTHFEILRTGQIKGRTDVGRTSVEIYGLRRDGLREDRRSAMEAVRNRADVLLQDKTLDAVYAELRADPEEARQPFTTARFWALEHRADDFDAETERLIDARRGASARARFGLPLGNTR